MAITIIMFSTEGTKYMSAMDCGIGVSAAVARRALSTANAVTAYNDQKDPEPPNNTINFSPIFLFRTIT